MKIIGNADQVSMPWKNGGGETIEIVRCPEDSSLDTFDWRISRARINISGPFSRFPGIDRTLIVLTGRGILLSVEGYPEVRLTRDSKPFKFDGGRAAQSRLLQGPVTDLNVMTKRGRFVHSVEIVPPDRRSSILGIDEGFTVFFANGEAEVESASSRTGLATNEALVLTRGDDKVAVATKPSCRLYQIDIRPGASPK
jgi:environmental stress-induced protein Ves